ncbi:MAG: DUF4190 domain-containing protein [Planctomycetota bacterium]|jgi:hypothetical protein
MNCPKCGTKNPDDAQVCTSCSAVLNPVSKTTEEITTKTSGLAIAALVLGILSLFSCGITAILAIILGIIGYVKIEMSGGSLTGRGFAVIGIGFSVIALFLLGTIVPALNRIRGVSGRMVCGSNLSGIGRAMLIYANDYDNNYPRAGGPTTKWGTTPNWQANNSFDAFGLKRDRTGGSATISSSLYLLVKYVEVMPKSFICLTESSNVRIKEFKPRKYGAGGKKLYDFWDFGPEPAKHCSYSYHMPYGPHFLSTASSEPGMAVASDLNPWIDAPGENARDFSFFDPNGDRAAWMAGNVIVHESEGQNVLFMDNHVSFETRSFCAFNDDNIYTYWNGSDIRQGAPPTLTSQPADKLDSLLVNDPPIDNSK